MKWYERCKRINFNKIYIITSDGNGVTPEELNSLSCDKVLVFTKKKNKLINNSFPLYSLFREKSGASHMIVRNHKGEQTLFNEFNFKRWLKGYKNYRYHFGSFYYTILGFAYSIIKRH